MRSFKNTRVFLGLMLLIILFTSNVLGDNWERQLIGTYGSEATDNFPYRSALGDGRNDGVNRLYIGTYNGRLLEYTYNPGTEEWDMELCASVTHLPYGYNEFTFMKIADGRNDGTNRIYVSCYNGNNYEFTYDQLLQDWLIEVAAPNGHYPYGLVVDNIRNDGLNRVFTHGNYSSPVQEASWSPGWEAVLINNQNNRDLFPGDAGIGRNDGMVRIYLPERTSNRVWEFTWNQSTENYDIDYIVEGSKEMHRLIVGDGRDDGIQRLYVSQGVSGGGGGSGSIIEFEYNGSGWDEDYLRESYSPTYQRFELAIGKAQADDKKRLYSIEREGYLVEHEYQDGDWEQVEIDAVSGATANLAVGDGRNDGNGRIYISGSSGNIYEYTHPDFLDISGNQVKLVEKNSIKLSNHPNPFNPVTFIDFYLKEESTIKLTVYNSKGELIKTLASGFRSGGNHSVMWNGTNENNEGVASGVYYYKLKTEKEETVSRMILMK